MAYIYKNPNPQKNLVGDCVIRAVSIAQNIDWDTAFLNIMAQAYSICDMPSSNAVWSQYLLDNGYTRYVLADTCTINEFCNDNKRGTYILATGSHVVTSINGDYMDTWDSGDEIVIYYFVKEQ